MQPIVLLCSGGESSRIVYHFLENSIPISVVIQEQNASAWQLTKRRLKKLGIRRTAGQLMFRAAIVPFLRLTSRKRVAGIKREFRLDSGPIPSGVVKQVASVNDEAAIEELRRLRPAVVVVNGTRILSEKILSCVSATFINTHIGITPLYRGVHGGYWALTRGDHEHCGVTVHVVDRGIDTGEVIAQANITPTKEDNFVTYPLLQLAAGLPLLKQAVIDAEAGTLVRKPPPSGISKLWSHPTLGEYLKNRSTRGIR